MRLPLSSCSEGGFSRADLVFTVGVVLCVIVCALLVQRRFQARAQMQTCLANLQAIGGAVTKFSDEHSGTLPGLLQSEAGDPWWFYKEQVKGYLGLTGASSENDRQFACPSDRGYSDPGPFARNPRFDFSSYVFNGVTLRGTPNIAGWEIGKVIEPARTLAVMEWCAHAPLSWHRSRTGKANRPFYSDAESVVSFVDGHAEMVKIYYDGFNAAYTRDPIQGYRYRYSGR